MLGIGGNQRGGGGGQSNTTPNNVQWAQVGSGNRESTGGGGTLGASYNGPNKATNGVAGVGGVMGTFAVASTKGVYQQPTQRQR